MTESLYAMELPFSTEAEEAVLGAVMINPVAMQRLTYLTADDFYLVRNKHMWRTYKRLVDDGSTIDVITVKDSLERQGLMDDIGGLPYLIQLSMNTPDSTKAEFYGRIVERAAIRRSVIIGAEKVKQAAKNEALPVEEVLSTASEMSSNVRRPSEYVGITAYDAALKHMEVTEQRVMNPQAFVGTPWSIKGLNYLTRGKPKKLIVVAGRPGMGKSSVLISEAVFSALAGKSVYFATIEMDEEEITTGMISVICGVPYDNIIRGDMSKEQYSRYVKAAGEFSKLQILIDDSPHQTPLTLYEKALQRKLLTGSLDEVYVDYLQLMKSDENQNQRVLEVDAISNGLAENAKKLKASIIAGAQLSRLVEQRADKRPMLSDLRESGGIEQAAYMVIGLYRDDYYSKPVQQPPISVVEMAVLKNRGGRTGATEAGMTLATRKFVDLYKGDV